MPKLAVGQIECAVGDVAANIRKGADLINEAAQQGADLACLPECFSTGLVYGRMSELAEPLPGPTSAALQDAAAAGGLWVVAGMVEQAGAEVYNTALIISPDGRLVDRYRKCYLYMQEAERFAHGDRACLRNLGFVKAGITICYDYVFPEYMRELVVRGARLLVHPTAWVDTESCRTWRYPAAEAYRAQGMVRALENGVYFMSANHCGSYDSAGLLQGVGRSAIIAPWGEVLAEVEDGEGVAVAEAEFDRIAQWAETAAPYLADHLSVPRPR
ncbi:MAG: carbon-nitrogen hydrolase family protein [Armatimonadota bacterium]